MRKRHKLNEEIGWFLPNREHLRTLSLAQAALDQTLRAGLPAACPCCGQNAKVYPRPLNGQMVRALAFLAVHGACRPVDMPAWMLASREYSKLPYWGLATSHKNDKSEVVWSATPLGVAFAGGRAQVPFRVFLYDGKVIARSADLVTWEHCLAEFNLGDLLNPSNVGETRVQAA